MTPQYQFNLGQTDPLLSIAQNNQVKKYPNVFSGIEIGNGAIKINIPSFDKQLVFDYNDIESFKQNLLN